MSILKIRKMFEKKGCIVVAYVLGFFVAVGLLYSGTCRGLTPWAQPPTAESGNSQVVLQIGSQVVTTKDVTDLETKARQQQNVPSGPDSDFQLINFILEQTIDTSAKAGLAEKRGVKFSDALVKEVLNNEFDQTIQSEKLQMVQDKTLKPNYTEAEFVEAFKKKSQGKTPDEIKADQVAMVEKNLTDPAQADGIKKAVLALALTSDYAKKSTATVDDLKKSYETFNLRQLVFDDPKKTPAQKTEDAKKALAEIKAGMKFEDAQAKYAKGKPATPQPYTRSILDQLSELKPVLTFKPGQTTDVISQGNNAMIFQLVNVNTSLPPDFEKNKDNMLRQFKAQQASDQMNKDLEDFKKSNLVWKDDGFKLANDVYHETQLGQPADPNRSAKLLELSQKAAQLIQKGGGSDQILSLARYAAYEAYYVGLPVDKKKEAAKERVEVLRSVLTQNESIQVRLDLYDTLTTLEEYEEAGDALVEAAQNNSGTDPLNIKMNGEIQDRANKAEKAGKVEKVVIEKVRKEVARWEKDRIEEEKAMKEESKPNATVDKELDKLDDPDAKKKADADKKSPPPAKKDEKK